jgi:choline-sulfatase
MTETGKLKGMNVILFLTDQERAIQHFPPGWAKQNLPGQTQLKKNGLTFARAFCAASMCSPSRSSMMTGYFPAQTGVKWTLEQTMHGPKYPQQVLPMDLPNLGTVMAAAGYATPYKGKFHLTKYPEKAAGFVPHDVNKYGFQRWDPQDAGANQDPSEFGGGNADNDGRFMNSTGSVEEGDEGVIAYLQSDAAKQGPFFLVVSLVNPHDVLAYPKENEANGYSDPSWFEGSNRPACNRA